VNRKYSAAASIILAIIILAGCITTGTIVITAKVAPKPDDSPIAISNQDYTEGKIIVDITNDASFKDYKGNIKNIDNIGFYARVRNEISADATFQLFLEGDTSITWTSPDTVVLPASGTYLIFTGLMIPAGDTVEVTWNESMEYIDNLDEIKEVLETGIFSLYPVAIPRNNFRIEIDSLVVIITLTGKK
jgi:hypothetical protein